MMISKIILVDYSGDVRSVMSALSSFDVESVKLGLPEVQSVDACDVAKAKAYMAYRKVKKPVFVLFSGFYFDALKSLPGAFINHFVERLGPDGVVRLLDDFSNRKVRAETVIAYCSGKDVKVFNAEIKGHLVRPRGDVNAGWESIIVPEGTYKTLAEMNSDERSDSLPRNKALKAFRAWLSDEKA